MSIDDYNLGLADGKESIMKSVCAKCGEALDAVVGIDRHGRMYHPECDPKDALSNDTRARILEAESQILLAQRQWERVKLVASMAVTLYCRWDDGTKTPQESMKMCVNTAHHFLIATEEALK